jgi:hypothetical protein
MGMGLMNAGSLPTQLGAWVPGQLPNIADEGRAVRIPRGGKIVMQVHYNVQSSAPEPDQTEFRMMLTETPPEVLTATRPAPILSLRIPAGEPSVTQAATFTNYDDVPVTITTLAGHMHLLGTSISARHLSAAGEQCMLDIPAWDFNWQQSYRLPAGAPIVIAPGESFELTCTYDNSAMNQPVVNGEQLEPRTVTWGEGTLDEMCLLYMTVERPYVAAPLEPPALCSSTEACLSTCAASPSECFFGCTELQLDCMGCAIEQLVACAPSCLPRFAAARACLTQCAINNNVLGGGIGACMEAQCATLAQNLFDCLDPVLETGACDAGLASCNITLPRG